MCVFLFIFFLLAPANEVDDRRPSKKKIGKYQDDVGANNKRDPKTGGDQLSSRAAAAAAGGKCIRYINMCNVHDGHAH